MVVFVEWVIRGLGLLLLLFLVFVWFSVTACFMLGDAYIYRLVRESVKLL